MKEGRRGKGKKGEGKGRGGESRGGEDKRRGGEGKERKGGRLKPPLKPLAQHARDSLQLKISRQSAASDFISSDYKHSHNFHRSVTKLRLFSVQCHLQYPHYESKLVIR